MKCPCSNIFQRKNAPHLCIAARDNISAPFEWFPEDPEATIPLQDNGCLTTETKAAPFFFFLNSNVHVQYWCVTEEPLTIAYHTACLSCCLYCWNKTEYQNQNGT